MESLGFSSDEESEISPPSPPVVGYHNISSSTGHADLGEEPTASSFRCKGAPKDPHFHPDSLILRKQLIALLQPLLSLSSSPDDGTEGRCVADSSSSPDLASQLVATFDPFSINLSDPEGLQVAVSLARKNAHILQLLADDRGPPELGEKYSPKAGQLRDEVVRFLEKARALEGLDPSAFSGYLEALSWRTWASSSSSGRAYQPPREARGSAISNNGSPVFHYFHLLLDIKWGLLSATLLASREKGEELLTWVVADLLAMAQEFWRGKGEVWNCSCVKELWTLLRLLCEEIGLNFWGLLANSLDLDQEKEDTVQGQDPGFVPLLIGELAALSDYNLCGFYSPGRELAEPFKYNGYFLVKELLKRSPDHFHLYPLTSQLGDRWGPDLDLLQSLWQGWVGKLDKRGGGGKDLGLGGGAGQVDYSSSVEKWGQLVSLLAKEEKDPLLESWTRRDEFLGFLRALVLQGKRLKGKEWRKLKSHLGMNLNKGAISALGELGLVRVATMYLTLAAGCEDAMALCDRLSELLQHSVKSSKICLKAKAVGIHLLLKKQISLSTSELQVSFMSAITMTMAQSPLDSAKKEVVMLYLELLDVIPKGPQFQLSSNLGRDTLISPNLTMWLSSCGPNHSVRTLRTLRNLTDWILSQWDCKDKCEEGFLLIGKIFERTTQFLIQSAVLQTNRCPKTDLEPLASLASNLTIFSKWNYNQQTNNNLDALKLFDHFALNERTSPDISQFYVTHLLLSQSNGCLLEGLPDLKWFQAWIRLNILDLPIPEALNEKVIGPFSSTSNLELLKRFCLRSDEMSKGDLANILLPLIPLVKGTCSGSIFKGENASEPWTPAVINGTTKLLKHLDFDNFYVKGDQMSLAGQLFTALLPPLIGTPPWEKLPKLVISSFKENYFELFLTLISSPNFGSDSFLLRKLQDLFNLAVLAFLDEEMGDDHPLVQLLIHAEDHNLTVITQKGVAVLLKLVKEDPRLWARLVSAAYSLRKIGLLTSCSRFLPGVLSAYVNLDESKIRSQAVSVISYVLAVGKEPSFREIVQSAFQQEMDCDFWRKPKRFFELAKEVLANPQKNTKLTVKEVLLPLFCSNVEFAESKRGTINDPSLREPLLNLEKAVSS